MKNIPSCNIFKRKDGSEAVFTSDVFDEKGYRRTNDDLNIIKLPTSDEIIANTIKKSIEISKLKIHINSADYKGGLSQIKDMKSNKILHRDWYSISISLNEAKDDCITNHFIIKSGYTFNTRKNGVGYKSYPSFHLPLTATDEEIGEAFRKAFDAIDGITG